MVKSLSLISATSSFLSISVSGFEHGPIRSNSCLRILSPNDENVLLISPYSKASGT